LDRRANLVARDVPIRQALEELQARSGVPIAFSTDFLPESRLVTCVCEAVPVRAALDRILMGTDLQYQEMRAHVLIEPAYRQEPLTQEVRVGGLPVRLELTEYVVKLDELVVTGTAGEAQKRTLGNDVGRVGVSELVQVAPPVKLQDMISVNVPGVRIFRTSGE